VYVASLWVAGSCAGWTDWLDGWAARRFGQQSVVGTYLDPLADKSLMCCVVAALGVQARRRPPRWPCPMAPPGHLHPGRPTPFHVT